MVVFPEVETVALTMDTNAAVDTFIEGATVTTPTVVVVTTPAADEEFDVVIVARAAIAPEPLTVDTDVVPEVLEVVVVPDVVDLITGTTTAVTTVAVVLEVPDPNPLTEFDAVLPTAATTDVLITDESDTAEPAADEAKDLDKVTAEETAVHDGEVSDEARDALAEVCGVEEEEIISTSEVLVLDDTGLVIPYGFGAKQHIICALDEDLAPLVRSSSLSIVTTTVEDFTTEDVELDVTGTLLVSGVSLSPDTADTTPSTLSTGCWIGWIISATRAWPFGVHMSRPKQPIFAGMSWITSPMVPSDDLDPGVPLVLGVLSAGSKEDLIGVEIICPRKDSVRFGWAPSDFR